MPDCFPGVERGSHRARQPNIMQRMDATIQPIVYIVDDDASVRRALRRLIITTGMNAETFASAHEFLESLYREDGACLLVDIQMPGITGLALQQQLLERGSRIPVIFITAYDTPESRREADDLGAYGYYRKPVDGQVLLQAIEDALSKAQNLKAG